MLIGPLAADQPSIPAGYSVRFLEGYGVSGK